MSECFGSCQLNPVDVRAEKNHILSTRWLKLKERFVEWKILNQVAWVLSQFWAILSGRDTNCYVRRSSAAVQASPASML